MNKIHPNKVVKTQSGQDVLIDKVFNKSFVDSTKSRWKQVGFASNGQRRWINKNFVEVWSD